MRIVDRKFKDGLMMYCQMELVKDVTFEKLLVNFCIAKREASGTRNKFHVCCNIIYFHCFILLGVLDNEILDIDWFEVMTGFRVSLEKRLIDNKDLVLDAIKLYIDDIDNDDMTGLDREAEKDRYVSSAEAWLKHGVRMIRGVTSRCVNKVGAYWETLNFLPPGTLKSSIISNGTNKSSLFANMTSHSNLLLGNCTNGGIVTNSAAGDGIGIDSLLYQVMRSNSGKNDDHMNNLIKYTKIPRDKYKIIPRSHAAMENWLLEKNIATTESSSSDHNSSSIQVSPPSVASTSNNNSEVLLPFAAADGVSLYPSSPATSTDSRGSSVAEEGENDRGDNNGNVSSNKLSTKLMSLSVTSSPSPTEVVCTTDSVKYHMRDLLKVLYAGVCGQDDRMCLKVNAINNSRNPESISFMRFLEANGEVD
jgi:hypothetical protein